MRFRESVIVEVRSSRSEAVFTLYAEARIREHPAVWKRWNLSAIFCESQQ